MQKESPNLSIIIPCYNYARYLPQSVDSVLSQDYSDYELILIDDGSLDETWPIMRSYASQYPQIKAIRHTQNLGIFHANQTGWDAAQGTFLHFFSSDDFYLPSCLSQVMELFAEHPELNLVCTDISYYKEKENLFEVNALLKHAQNPQIFSPSEMVSIFQTTDFWIPGLTCIVKNTALKKYGHLIPKLENISDWYCFHKIALFEGIGYVPEPLISMRLHDQTYTSVVKRDKKRKRNTYRALLEELAKERQIEEKFKESGLLTFIFRELKWQLRLNPRYYSFRKYFKKIT